MKKINYPSNRYTGPKPWMNKDWLYNEYVVKDRSTQEIADEYGCKQNTIQVWLLNHGIKKPILTHNIKRDNPYQQYDWLYNEHIIKHRSMAELAQECGVSQDAIRENCKRVGIKTWRLYPPVDITPYRDAIIARYLKGESMHMLSLRYGSSSNSIKKLLQSNGIKIRSVRESQYALLGKPTDPRLDDPDWLSEMKENQHMQLKEMGKILSVDPKTVRSALDKYGIDMDPDHVYDKNFLSTYDECLSSLIRLVREYHAKRLVVIALRRDNFTCQHCGTDLSLQVHHKVPLITIVEDILSEHPKLNIISPRDRASAYNIIIKDPRFLSSDNLLTLCRTCHTNVHAIPLQDNQQPSLTENGEEGSTTIERIS